MRILLLAALCAVFINGTRAAVVAQWDFNTGTTLPANASSQDSHVTGTPTLDASLPPNPINNTAVGIVSQTLQYSYGGSHGSDLNGSVLTFTISTSGSTFAGFSATYNSTLTSLTGVTGTWSYSINGGSFVNIGTSESISAGANSDTLTGLALAQNDSLVLHFTLTGFTGGNNGILTFDDFTINAGSITTVPEPMVPSLAVFGLILLSGTTVRAYSLRFRRAVSR